MLKKMLKKVLVPFVCVTYFLYWIVVMTRFNLGTMESYVFWTVLWLNFGALSGFVFYRGHETAVQHLREEGIRHDNKRRYLPVGIFAVVGLIGYYAVFKYCDSQGIIWGAVVPVIYLIFIEEVSRFVLASKLKSGVKETP